MTGFPGVPPADMGQAYAIQDAAIERWSDTLVGWKIGYIPEQRRADGEPDRLVGPIWRRGCVPYDGSAPVDVDIFAAGFAAVEAELVVRLRQDLPPRPSGGWTAAQVAGLEQQLMIGIEVASSPIPDINAFGPTVIAADFGNNNGLVLGGVLEGRADGAGQELTCSIDGQLVGRGTAEKLPGGLHHGLATALNVLADRGHRVPAGTVFATGAVTGIHEIGPGQRGRVDVRNGPSVEVRTR